MDEWKYFVLIFVVFEICYRGGHCGFFDYTDFDDPLQFLWNTKNQVTREPNSPCAGNIGSVPVEGVCKSHAECRLTGGVFSGSSCGFLATCCIYAGSCGSKFSTKLSYFSDSSASRRQNCVYEVQMHNRNICQLRLDFLHMNLAPPAQDNPQQGSCRDERFFVEGYPNIPQICGTNTGQHMYIPVNGNDSTPIKLHIDLLKDISARRGWAIKITQLHCPGTTVFPYRTQIMSMARDFALLAPQNCLQYFTDLKGSFRSFGFDLLNPNASTYNVNQSYAICFKRYNGICGISYTPDYFKIGQQTSSASTIGSDDFLYVPALRTTDTFRDERISGQQNINNVFTSVTPGPFYVYFRSDSNPENGTDLGFHIKYELSTSCP